MFSWDVGSNGLFCYVMFFGVLCDNLGNGCYEMLWLEFIVVE